MTAAHPRRAAGPRPCAARRASASVVSWQLLIEGLAHDILLHGTSRWRQAGPWSVPLAGASPDVLRGQATGNLAGGLIVGVGQQRQDLADGTFPAVGLGERQVGLDLVAVA